MSMFTYMWNPPECTPVFGVTFTSVCWLSLGGKIFDRLTISSLNTLVCTAVAMSIYITRGRSNFLPG
jgi:hypothetical protein